MEQSQGTGAAGGALSGAAAGSAFGPWGAAIGGVIGGISGFLGGGGEKKAKKLAKAQAAEIKRVAKEATRRQERQMMGELGTAKAATYASNIMDTGSSRLYRDSMEVEYRKQIQFDIDTAKANANAALQGGQNAADSIKKAGWGQLLGGVASAGTAYAGAGGFDTKASSPWVGKGELGYAVPGSGGSFSKTDPGGGSLLLKKSNYNG